MPRSEIAGIVVAILAVLGGLTYLYERASRGPAPMENGELLRVARQLASDARESERLTLLVATGQLNEHYAKAHHRKIADDIHEAQDLLDTPPPRGREADAKRAGELAAQMKALLEGAAPRLADRDALAKLKDEHARIAAELEGIASR